MASPRFAALALLAFLASCAPARPVSVAAPETYFTYAPAEIAGLTLASGEVATAEHLYGWDELAFRFAGEEDAGPTTASELLASLTVAERDALLLSRAIGGALVRPTLDTLAAETICLYLPTSCGELSRGVPEAPDALAALVLERVRERHQRNIGRPLPQRPADAAWQGGNPVTPDAGGWDLWMAADAPNVPPPPVLGSPEDARELQAVRDALRDVSLPQKKALFRWSGWRGSETPSGLWLRAADNELRLTRSEIDRAADVRARVAVAMADAFTRCWSAKFTFWTARPSDRDPAIRPLLPVPTFPSYPSGHATVSAAAAVVLEDAFGGDGRFRAMAEEAAWSRVWAGIHFPVDSAVGTTIGTAVGEAALAWR